VRLRDERRVTSERGRWELGGFFELCIPPGTPDHALSAPSVFFRSATDALVGLLSPEGACDGRRRTLHLPTYFCHEVTRTLCSWADIRFYDDGPTAGPIVLELDDADVAVAVEYFGAPHHVVAHGGTLVVDRTHDPLATWAYERDPDFVVASLRKTLPVPDGGALWSPAGRPLPAPPTMTEHHLESVLQALMAMALRRAHLSGIDVDKPAYLHAHAASEQRFSEGELSAISDFSSGMLRMLPLEAMRAARARNLCWLADRWPLDHPWLERFDNPGYLVLLADDGDRRDALRRALIARDVYPAIFWDLSGVPAGRRERRFSDRMLVLHADFRYDEADMSRLLEHLLEASGHA
jgi:hypothetical protein